MTALSEEDKKKIRIFAGSASTDLAEKIAKYLEVEFGTASNEKILRWRNIYKIRRKCKRM